MAIVPAGFLIAFNQLQAQITLVYQRVNVQSNATLRINNTVRNTDIRVTRIQNYDDPQLRRLAENIRRNVRSARNEILRTEETVNNRGESINTSFD